MPLQCVSPEVLLGVCVFLPVPDTLNLAATRKTFRRLLTGPTADNAVWSLYAGAQLADLFGGLPGVPDFNLARWNVSTYRRLCQVLKAVGSLLGHWRLDVPVRGGSLLVSLDVEEEPYATIVADLVLPNQCSSIMVQNVTEFHTTNLFEIHFDDDDCAFTVDGVRVQASGLLQVPGSAALEVAQTLPVASGNLTRDSPLVVMGEYLQALARRPLRFHRLPAAPRPSAAPGTDPFAAALAGLYEGVFGPHGLEMLCVGLDAEGLPYGLKVTGDPNVPAGQLCFRTVGPMEPADPTCDCQHGCGCWRPDRDAARGWALAGMYRVEARTALHGFRNPQWNRGRLLCCTQRDNAAPSDCYVSPAPQGPSRFLILAWDGLFSTRLAPLQW